MTTQSSRAPSRVVAVDLLRGLVMMLMVVDHLREFFFLHAQVTDPVDLAVTSPALALTRFASHPCAPVFVFLAGVSAWLSGQKQGGDRRAIATHLLKRGLFLVALEVTVVNFAWTFTFPPTTLYLQVIWAIGLAMIALAGLIWLPPGGLLAVSLAAGLWVSDTASADSAKIEGRGTLYARGAGLAYVAGSGEVEIQGHGVGLVVARGAEAVRAEGHGRRYELPDGSTVLVGWEGKIFVAGRDMKVLMVGGKIEFTAHGEGLAYLRGRGTYRVGHHSGAWTSEGVTVQYSP